MPPNYCKLSIGRTVTLLPLCDQITAMVPLWKPPQLVVETTTVPSDMNVTPANINVMATHQILQAQEPISQLSNVI